MIKTLSSNIGGRCLLCSQIIRSLSSSTVLQKKPVLKDSINVDWVGPPDPDSNIRRVVYSRSKHEDVVVNEEQANAYEWNNTFWKNHNKKFFEEKREFIESTNAASGKGQDVSDKLSLFYKEFLNTNQKVYMDYNKEWYKRNFRILWLTFKNSFSIKSKKEKSL